MRRKLEMDILRGAIKSRDAQIAALQAKLELTGRKQAETQPGYIRVARALSDNIRSSSRMIEAHKADRIYVMTRIGLRAALQYVQANKREDYGDQVRRLHYSGVWAQIERMMIHEMMYDKRIARSYVVALRNVIHARLIRG